MDGTFTLLWIGKVLRLPAIATALTRAGHRVLETSDLSAALRFLGGGAVDLIVLENEVSCVQGELAAVRLKSAAPRVPILLLCEPRDSGIPQVFFVNLILGLKAAPDLLLRAIETLLPRGGAKKKTGT